MRAFGQRLKWCGEKEGDGRESDILLCFWWGKEEKENNEGKPTSEGAEARKKAWKSQTDIVAPRKRAEILFSLLMLLHRCHLFSIPITVFLTALSL